MKTDVETLGPTRVKLTVDVPFEELQPSLGAAYRKISGQIRVKGFRPGRVPPAIIDRQLGRGAVLEEAINSAVPRLYADAVREQSVDAIGHPDLAVTSFADGANLVFTAEVDVRPRIDLPEYESLEVTVDEATPSEADVTEQVEALRARFGTLRSVERPVRSGDFVTLDLSGERDGERVEEMSATGLSYEVGSGQLIDGLDEAIIGKSAGEAAEFRTPAAAAGAEPAGDAAAEGAGVAQQPAVTVTATVRSIRERELPELDDDFAQTASEFDTLDELRESIRERLGRVRRLEQGLQARDRVVEALLSRLEVPTPEHVFGDEIAARHDAIERELAQAGLTRDSYLASEGKTSEEFEQELENNAREAIKGQLVLDEIARREQLTVSQAELTEQVIRRASQAQISPDDYAQRLVQEGQLPALGGEILRNKALALVMSKAKVVDTAGRPVDMSELTGTPASGTGAGAAAEPDAEEAAANQADANQADANQADANQADVAPAGAGAAPAGRPAAEAPAT